MNAKDFRPGMRIGSLVLVERARKTLSSGRHMPAWRLTCDCGAIVVAMTVNLTKGKHQSCGCQKRALVSSHYRGDTKRPEYRVYRQMLDRCYLATAANYLWYGARGVTVCDRWRFGSEGKTGFGCFLDDMGPRPVGLTLERKDPRGPYGPDNCCWATWNQQAANRRENYLSQSERAALSAARSARVRGEMSGNSKLKTKEVAEIKRCLSEGARGADLARRFNVAAQTISGIKRGDKWAHVQAAGAQ